MEQVVTSFTGSFENRCAKRTLKLSCSAPEKIGNAGSRDNGPQFIAKDFKTFIRVSGMSHVRTSPYYPQSNGKLERWHKTQDMHSAQSASNRRRSSHASRFLRHYNQRRLHSAIGYVTPADNRDVEILARRDAKLEQARQRRAARRRETRTHCQQQKRLAGGPGGCQ